MVISSQSSSNYYVDLNEKLKDFIKEGLTNSEFYGLQNLKSLEEWYNEKKNKKKETILNIVDRMSNEIVNQVVPPYISSLIKKIEIKSQLKQITLNDIEIGLIDTDIHPYIEFIKLFNSIKTASTKFKFHFNMVTYIKKIKIKAINTELLLDIEKMGIEIKFSLVGIEVRFQDISLPLNSLKEPITIANSKIEIKNLSFPFSKTNVQRNYGKDSIVKQIKNICRNCQNNNPFGSNFCNKCGSELSIN